MVKKDKKYDEVLEDKKVFMTNDYSKFKTMEGNRQINKQHVNQLIKLMTTNGNLTDQFPIVVDNDGYIIDGQHRFEALKTLGWEVGYTMDAKANIETVRRINQGNRNWSWRDVAESYANLGNDEYEWFLHYFDKHNITFTLAMLFTGSKMNKRYSAGNAFNIGELKVEDKAKADEFANQYEELVEITDVTTHDFGKAFNRIVRSPFYNHERMVSKLQAMGNQLPAKATAPDYLRELERIYNHGFADENKARLF